MITLLTNFLVVVVSQFIFLLIHARTAGASEEIPKLLMKGLIFGLVFGVVFDLIVGKWAGVFEYEIGFIWWFLIINGLFSYGLMMANVLLLHKHSLLHLIGWSMMVGTVYEIANYFFPVWSWTFMQNSALEYMLVILFAYTGLTLTMMIVMQIIYTNHFRIFANVPK